MYEKPLSHSSLNTYRQCPRKWYYRYIEGLKEAPGKAAERGLVLHSRLEEFFLGAPYPAGVKELRPWQRFMEALTIYAPQPEKELAVNKEWEPVDFEDPLAYFRGKLDLTYEDQNWVNIFDWKSGKIYQDDHDRQGISYVALSAPHRNYRTHFVYLDLPLVVHAATYSASDRVVEIGELIEQVERVRLDETYDPTPSYNVCKWCQHSWRNGGPCRAAP